MGKLNLYWTPDGDRATLYYPNQETDAGTVGDQRLAAMICQRFNSLAGMQDVDALHELLDRLPAHLTGYNLSLYQRAVGVKS